MATPTLPQHRDPAAARAGARALLALAALVAALLGGGAALALALATGALHTGATSVKSTTVTRSASPQVSTARASGEGWAPVYARVAPGTVDITVHATASVNTPFGIEQQQQTDMGAGVVIDGRGDILTAAHVISGANTVAVTFQDGVTRGARVLGADYTTDTAVLRVEPAGLSLYPATLGSDRALAVGDPVAVIGDPLGFDRSLSSGVVSALDRTIESPDGFEIPYAIQTDASLNPGNSGGPVLNTRGEVLGLADQIATGVNQFGHSDETSTGVGFAVPIDPVRAELAQLERGEHVSHAYLGVSTSTSETPGRQGALVEAVQAHTPAARAGLRSGDVIVAFDGAPIRSADDLIDALAAAHAGARATLTVVRGSKRVTFTVRLASQPAQSPAG